MSTSPTTLEVTQGDTLEFPVTITDKRSGDAIAITGSASLWFTVKANFSDADPGLCQKIISNGITLRTQSGDTTGMADVTLQPADTAAFPAPAALQWDIQYDDGLGNSWTVASGLLAVSPQVTQAA